MNKENLVLLIEDSAEIQLLYKIAFANSNIRVETASTRNEALELIRLGLTPQLIIMDVRMVGMPIGSFLNICRDAPNTSRTNIIAVSSFSENAPQLKGLEIPFLQKPTRLIELIALVTDALEINSAKLIDVESQSRGRL